MHSRKKNKKNEVNPESPEDIFLNKKNMTHKITDPIGVIPILNFFYYIYYNLKTLKEEMDENKRAAASKILINQLVKEIYGDDLENIEEKEKVKDDFRFSTAMINDHGTTFIINFNSNNKI